MPRPFGIIVKGAGVPAGVPVVNGPISPVVKGPGSVVNGPMFPVVNGPMLLLAKVRAGGATARVPFGSKRRGGQTNPFAPTRAGVTTTRPSGRLVRQPCAWPDSEASAQIATAINAAPTFHMALLMVISPALCAAALRQRGHADEVSISGRESRGFRAECAWSGAPLENGPGLDAAMAKCHSRAASPAGPNRRKRARR